MNKPTLATLKSFINREWKNNNLYIKQKSNFDGMTDCVQDVEDTFEKAVPSDSSRENTLGFRKVYIVRGGRDYITVYSENDYSGYEVSNCCGSFIVAKRLFI